MELSQKLEETYADTYIHYVRIVRDKSEPNWRAYEVEAHRCYVSLSKDVQRIVDEKLVLSK